MKKIKMSRGLTIALSLLITATLFIVGKGEAHEAPGMIMANIGLITLTEAEKSGFSEGEKKVIAAVEKLCGQVQTKANQGLISKEEIGAFMKGVQETYKNDEIAALSESLKKLDEVAKAQGTSLGEMELKLQSANGGGFKSISEVLQENEAELKKVYQTGSGSKTFMVQVNAKGELVMKPFDTTSKAAGPHATVSGVSGGGNTPSITTSIDAASLLRLGGNSQIISNYRNTSWVFDLANVVNAGFEMPFAMWYEEVAKQGSSATVPEGGTKPATQYSYNLKTNPYKKEATLVSFTEEFAMDFARLQDDIMNKGRVDVINRINTSILANVTTAATAYNTAVQFKGGDLVTNANDFDALAAMAAQVDNATFGAMANTAVMSTFKKYRMGITKSTQAEYVDRPSVLDNLAFIGNPDMAADAVMVGDFKAYNIILRGGFIVKIGYNGTDFAENKFSVVMEQYYYDYISAIRQSAIVKGPTFAAVKTAISS